jgi:preprotein translocase subunit SecA
MKRQLTAIGMSAFDAKEREVGPELMRLIESQYVMLPIIDRLWVDHLYVMDALKTGIGLRGYGQKDPRVEYEKEAYGIFEDLKNNIAEEAIKRVFQIQIETEPPPGFGSNGAAMPEALAGGTDQQMDPLMAAAANVEKQQLPDGAMPPRPSRLDSGLAEKLLGPAPGSNGRQREVHTNRDDDGQRKPVRAAAEKVGRNDLCPCGSGKKFKRCHGVTA